MFKIILNRFKRVYNAYGDNLFVFIYKLFTIGLKGFYKVINSKIRAYFKMPYFINYDNIDIELTTACNLNCYNCDRSCGTAPSKEHLTLEQIKCFIDESIKYNKKWNEIKLLGGEPTLHPQFWEILDILREYQLKYSPDTSIAMATNGYGSKVNNILEKLPKWVRVLNTKKTSNVQEFSTYNVAPIDLEEYKNSKIDYSSGCWILESCGLGLTPNGYYACGAGGSADRIFGWDIGLKSLKDVNEKNLRKQLNTMCRFCGHFKDYGRYRLSNYGLVTEQVTSKSWEKAYKKWKENPPKFHKYCEEGQK
jgi:uncharacterized Fe-S cluster-containing radical SAM superfamily protein